MRAFNLFNSLAKLSALTSVTLVKSIKMTNENKWVKLIEINVHIVLIFEFL